MASHITSKKPPLIKVFLHKLGLIDLHTKVNCWFCNQDSYILPGTKNTAEHWFCHLCENTNARDKRGDIIDPSPLYIVDRKAITIPPVNNNDNTSDNNNGRTLCKDCLEGQTLIYNMMSEYIPDETDPTYEMKCATASDRQAELHQRYKLCTQCQKLIEKVVAEQKEILRYQEFNRTYTRSLKDKRVEKRPPRKEYIKKGIICIATHSLTLIVGIYAALFSNDIMNWREIIDIENFKNLNFDFTKDQLTWDFISLKLEEFIHYTADNMNNSQWIMNRLIILLSILSVLSLNCLEWNYRITPILYEKVRNLKIYKSYQLFLFFLRFCLILIISFNLDSVYIYAIIVIYFFILYYSNNLVKPILKKEVTASFVMEESENEAEPMDISDEMSIVDSPPDEITNIINRLQTL